MTAAAVVPCPSSSSFLEERSLYLNNVWSELLGSELELACHKETSEFFEKLILACSHVHLNSFISALSEQRYVLLIEYISCNISLGVVHLAYSPY